jgi:hypothetical protein
MRYCVLAVIMAACVQAETMQVVSLNPTGGAPPVLLGSTLDDTQEVIYTVKVYDSASATTIGYTQLLFLTATPPGGGFAHGCVVRYAQDSNTFQLLGDDGATWGENLTGGYFDIALNSQCVLVMGGSHVVSASGNYLTVQFQIGFISSGMTYTQYTRAQNDSGSVDSGYVGWGHTTPNGTLAFKIRDMNSSSSGSVRVADYGEFARWTIMVNTLNGHPWTDIAVVEVVMTTESDPNNIGPPSQDCRVRYNTANTQFEIYSDSDSTWKGAAIHPRTDSSLSVGGCSVLGKHAEAFGGGAMLTITFHLQFPVNMLAPGNAPQSFNSFAEARNADGSVDTGFIAFGAMKLEDVPRGTGPRLTFAPPQK